MIFRVFRNKTKAKNTIRYSLIKEYETEYRVKVCSRRNEEKMAAFLNYKEEASTLFDLIKSDAILTESEAEFLHDQNSSRNKTIMEFLLQTELNAQPMDVDVDLPDQQVDNVGESFEEPERSDEFSDGSSDSDDGSESEVDAVEEESHLYFNLRSGKRVKVSFKDDTEDNAQNDSRIRIGPKIVNKKCLETIITMNVKAHITVNQARLCFASVQNGFNGQNLRLEPIEKQHKVPRTADDYKAYENVVPSESTIWNYRHKCALCKLRFLFLIWITCNFMIEGF